MFTYGGEWVVCALEGEGECELIGLRGVLRGRAVGTDRGPALLK